MRKDTNTIAKELFEYLCKNRGLSSEPIMLCKCDGTCLALFPADGHQNIHSDTTPPLAKIPDSKDLFSLEIEGTDYIIQARSDSRRLDEINKLKETFAEIFAIFRQNEQVNDFIFRGLDSLPISISVCDKDTRLVYANVDFCDYLRIKDREKAYGSTIDDITKNAKIKIASTKGDPDHLKMKDVIKYGKPFIDWEVEISSTVNPADHILASNDMYPLVGDNGKILGAVEIARSRHSEIKKVRNALGLSADYTFEDIIGDSAVMTEAKNLAMNFANSSYNILIYGESGVGKELFAQSIHNYSNRRNKPFVSMNCASVSPELIDSELFGYNSGAFTGASKNGQVGKFELADGGTLFLDEVAEMPLHFQTKLLRALETHQINRVGGSKNISVDVRIIAATNCSLEDMVNDGLFREDLYYRLMVLNLTIPPLREHPEDIINCAEHFLHQSTMKNNLGTKYFDKEAKRLLTAYTWPGNIRELRNVINRVSILSKDKEISRDVLYNSLQPASYRFNDNSEQSPQIRLDEKKNAVGRSHADLLKEALSIAKGNKSKAAELLGVSRKTFYHMLEKYKPFL